MEVHENFVVSIYSLLWTRKSTLYMVGLNNLKDKLLQRFLCFILNQL